MHSMCPTFSPVIVTTINNWHPQSQTLVTPSHNVWVQPTMASSEWQADDPEQEDYKVCVTHLCTLYMLPACG